MTVSESAAAITPPPSASLSRNEKMIASSSVGKA
jgi:hypothetical protein